MRAIGFGTVIAGVRPFSFNGNVNDTFRGEILCEDQQIVSAFIKDLPIKQLFNELVAAAVGKALDLPLPDPLLAVATPDVLAAKHVRYGKTGAHLVFASVAADAKPVLQLIRESGRWNHVIDRLAEWQELGCMYGFDSWIANIDRHQGNLLLGGDDEIWMIDHGHSFTGPAWSRDQLVAEVDVPNRLAEWLTPRLSGARRGQAAEEAFNFAKGAAQTDIERTLRSNRLDDILADEFSTIAKFLVERLKLVEPLSRKALGLLV